MINNLYSIHDKTAGDFAPPWTAKNDMVALRQFKAMLLQNPHVPASDLQLFKVGTYEDTYPFHFENDFVPVEIKEGE